MSSRSASSASLPTKAGATLPPADADDLDRLGDALQAHLARFGKREVAWLGGVPAGEHLSPLCFGGDASCLMDTLAAIVEPDARRVRLVDPDPHLRRKAVGPAVIGQRALDLDGALDGTLGLRETGEDAVSAVADLLAGMSTDQTAKRLVVPAQHLVPGLVAHGLDELGRLHDVGEHEGAGHRIAGGRLRRELTDLAKQFRDVALV